MTAIDISVPVFNGMLHPGRQPEQRFIERIDKGDPGNVSRWYIGAHTGTHVEAPLHTNEDGAAIDALPLDLFVGPARVLDLTGVATEITAGDLIAAGVECTEVANHDDSEYGISKDLHPGVFVRSVYFQDPDGILLELACWTRELGGPDDVAVAPRRALSPVD